MLGAIFAFLFIANQEISPAYAIVGGEPVKPHEFPFLVSFYLNGTWTGGCGGALISLRHVLSCAHCFRDKKAELMEAGFGKTVRANDEGVVRERVQSIAFHPDNIDIAIIILGAEVPLSEQVKTIDLPEVDSDYMGQTATLAWEREGMVLRNCSTRFPSGWALAKKILRPILAGKDAHRRAVMVCARPA